ncbi:MAG: type IV pilus twitching motility protein PilT [Candidatus Omnitrophica bacterium]|nr:type IV pilus twitching motility protein PilT [Candidatus Omnitrophota bacterium]
MTELKIHALLEEVKKKDASDLHLAAGLPPMLRIYGKLKPLGDAILTSDDIRRLTSEVLTPEQKKELEEMHEIDVCVEVAGVARFRLNSFYERNGTGTVMRLIPFEIRTLSDLGLPAVVGELSETERGFIIVTGPTGSGKSTTLAALVDKINSEREGHIITIEDPIEYVHKHKKCIVQQRQVGPHTHSFAMALRSALREDPDVILVGECRDLETMQMAVTAAETGHLVFTTLHTGGAVQTIDRIIDIFPPHQQAQVRTQLSEALVAVISQILIPRMDGKGLVAACEILRTNAAVRNLIREGKTYQIVSAIQAGGTEGMQTLEAALTKLQREGRITPDEVRKHITPARISKP